MKKKLLSALLCLVLALTLLPTAALAAPTRLKSSARWQARSD